MSSVSRWTRTKCNKTKTSCKLGQPDYMHEHTNRDIQGDKMWAYGEEKWREIWAQCIGLTQVILKNIVTIRSNALIFTRFSRCPTSHTTAMHIVLKFHSVVPMHDSRYLNSIAFTQTSVQRYVITHRFPTKLNSSTHCIAGKQRDRDSLSARFTNCSDSLLHLTADTLQFTSPHESNNNNISC